MTGRFAEHKGRHRLLLVFAPDEEDESLTEQKRLLEGREPGFEERDLLPVYSLEDGEARDEFEVGKSSFTAVLVGKDGAEKRRFERPVECGEIFRLVDEMPMRKRETRRGEMGRGA